VSSTHVVSPPQRGVPGLERLARARFWGRAITLALIAAYLLATYGAGHASLYWRGLLLVAAVYGMLAVSLDMVAGMIGLYSLGHAGLFALGAYGTTLLHNHLGWGVFALLPLVFIGVGLVGLVLGTLALRVSGLYFAITTFVFTLVVSVVASDSGFTGGYAGLVGPIFPDFPSGLAWLGQSLEWCALIGLLLTLLISAAIRRSPLYPVLLAIRDAEPFAAAAGARTSMIKVGMFGLSAAIAGAAGWIFSFQGIVSPGQFDWTVSVNILVMVILGGMNTLIGPVLGAAFVSIFPAYVNISPLWQEVLYGGLFVAVVIAFPSGFMGLIRAALERAARGLRGARPEPAGARAAARESHPEPVPSAVNNAVNGGYAVRCKGLVFSYDGGVRAVDGVDFTVREGTIHGLIGPNGSGKSTLVDLIAGRLRPLAGTIEVNGQRLEGGGPAARARHGFMRTFQAPVLVRELSCQQNVTIGAYTRVPRLAMRSPLWPLLPGAGADSASIRERAASALSFVGADGWGQARVSDAPHGVQQLTQLAAAYAGEPRTVILDEPVAGLAPSEVEHAAEILAELRARGLSVVLIEHQPQFVFGLCDEVTVLNAGSVVASGPAAEVRADARVREVYLGQ
jgi:branched-chain amino acid transport system permease protein